MNKNISIVLAIIIVAVLAFVGYSKFVSKPAAEQSSSQTQTTNTDGHTDHSHESTTAPASDGHTDHTDAQEPNAQTPSSDGHTDDGHN